MVLLTIRADMRVFAILAGGRAFAGVEVVASQRRP